MMLISKHIIMVAMITMLEFQELIIMYKSKMMKIMLLILMMLISKHTITELMIIMLELQDKEKVDLLLMKLFFKTVVIH